MNTFQLTNDRVFRYVDKNEDGLLNITECIDALRSCGYKLLDKGCQIVKNFFESTQKEHVNEGQFLELCKEIEEYQPIAADELRESLKFLAEDNGQQDAISLDTLRHSLTTLCDMKPAELDKWFTNLRNKGKVDDNNCCNIDAFVEFAMESSI